MIPQLLPLTALAFLAVYIQKGLLIVGFCLAVLGGAYVLWRDKGVDWQKVLRSRYAQAATLTLVLWLISSLIGIDPEDSLSKWAACLGLVAAGFVLYGALRGKGDAVWLHFTKTLFWGSLFFSSWAIVDSAYLLPRFSLLVHGPWMSVTSYSTVLTILFPFILWHAAISGKKLYWLVPFAAAVAIFACGGRSGWLAFAVIAPLCLTLLPWRGIGFRFTGMAVLAGAAAGACALGVTIYGLFVGTLKFQERTSAAAEHGLGTGRLDIWRFTWEKFLEHPILGVGPRNFRALDFSHVNLTSTMHPHNVPLELLVETGILGFGAAALFAGLLVFEFCKKFKERTAIASCAFIALTAYGVACMTLTSIFHAWWFVAGVVLYVWLKLALDDSAQKSSS